MKSKKPVIYFLTILAVVTSLEMTFRMNEQSILSIQNKMLLKKQMVMLRKPTHVLFLGSSRTQDGVEPRILMESTVEINPAMKDVNVFNCATAGTNINRLKYIVEQLLSKESLELMVVEVSRPQMTDGPLGFEFNEDIVPKTTEEKLHKILGDISYLVKYRKSFRLDSFRHLPILMLSNFSVGTELFRRAMLRDLTESIDYEVLDNEESTGGWLPKAVIPESSEVEIGMSEQQVKAFEIYKDIASMIEESDVKVIFLVQPLKGKSVMEEFDPVYTRLYKALSYETGAEVYVTSSLELSPVFFRDSGHLNKMGRTLWSDQLASTIIKSLKKVEKK